MPVTLDEFKAAFAGASAPDPLAALREEALEAVKEAEAYIKSLTDGDLTKKHAATCADLHNRIKAADAQAKSEPDKALVALRVARKDARQLVADVQADAKKQYDAVKKALDKGGDPKKSDFDALAKMPGSKPGRTRLDDLVDGLSDKTPQKVLKMAIECRFGQKVEVYKNEKDLSDEFGPPPEWEAVDDSKPNKSLQRIYQLLNKVPASHVQASQNPSLQKIIHFTKDDSGAAYWDVTKTAYMNLSRGTGVGATNYTDEISSGMAGTLNMFPDGRDEACMPKNSKVETPYFDWATLHEVGHAVDHKNNFMGTNGKDSKYGGWGAETLDTVAAAGAKEFGWDVDYIKEKLQGNPASVPAKMKKLKDWEKLRDKVDAWCNAIRDPESSQIWWDGTKSKNNQIDKRVYQEAYAGQWVSYEYGARSKGIHGYQFRAAGEWFAELYAAYYSDKLKDNHPAVKFLKSLES